MEKTCFLYLIVLLSATVSGGNISVHTGLAVFNTSRKGQDCASVHTFMRDGKPCTLAGVYDGHGLNGEQAAIKARDTIEYKVPHDLSKEGEFLGSLSESLSVAISQAGTDIKRDIDLRFAGTTAVIACIAENVLYLANVGDSRALIGLYDKNSNIIAHQPLPDHGCDNEDEVTRACEAGGKFSIRGCFTHGISNNTKLYDDWFCPMQDAGGCLLIKVIDNKGYRSRYTRSLEGFGFHHDGVIIGEPELCSIEIGDAHRFVILASDGVWDETFSRQISNEEAVAIVSQSLDEHGASSQGAQRAAQSLAQEARSRAPLGVLDDISVVVIVFTKED